MHQVAPASVQLFLFADRLTPADTAFSAGTRIAFSQKKVKTNELAVYLLAFSLWDLFHKNCIRLDIRHVRKMFFISVEKLFIILNKDIPVSGSLESWMMSRIRGEGEAQSIIRHILEVDEVWPHKKIIYMVAADACDMGLGRVSESYKGSSSVLRSLSGDLDFDVERSLVSKVEPEFELLLQQWQQFLVASPKTAKLLINACRSALNSRVIQND
jgi:hypothetical protein